MLNRGSSIKHQRLQLLGFMYFPYVGPRRPGSKLLVFEGAKSILAAPPVSGAK
jgi:hypothetical protein